jgi:hypothetical protein
VRVDIRGASGSPVQTGKNSMGKSTSDSSPDGVSSGYVTFLVVIALSGWTLASYDFNLLIVAFPDIAKELHLTASFLGLLGFVIYAAMFGITLFAGYGMDLLGRKKMWVWCLSGAASSRFRSLHWRLREVQSSPPPVIRAA